MSVLIKGMEMPIGCDGCGTSCPLLQWGLGDVYCRITHRHFDSIEDRFKYAKERPADCPLKPILPHSRLVDIDQLKEKIISVVCCPGENHGCHDCSRMEYCRILKVFEDVPTIIEKEEGE